MRRRTIGFVVDSIEEPYQSTVFGGVVEVARAAGANVLCFCGGVLEGSEAVRNSLFDWVSAANVDGVVVMSGAVGKVVGHDATTAFCAALRSRASDSLPIVSIADAIEGVPSVVVDNATGTREAIDHVVRAHGRRAIGFIRGPQTNVEAELRYRVYREVLARHGIEIDAARVACGNFDRASGADAVQELLARGMPLDAIVAASDEMAIGAIEALVERGVRVPEDVLVVGFDDIETARFCVPALTTVRQPLHEQGRRAAEMVLAQIDGLDQPEHALLHTELVTRRSCGCGPLADGRAPSAEKRDGTLVATAAEMAHALGAPVDSADGRHCLRVLEAFDAVPAGSAFLRALEEALRARLASGEPVGPWQDAISVVRRARPDGDGPAVDAARALTSRYAERAQRERGARIERLTRALSETSSALATSFDTATLAESLHRHLPELGIESAYVTVPRGTTKHACLFAMTGGAVRALAPATFSSHTLVPESLLPDAPTTFVVEPLFFEDERLGVALLEMGQRLGSIYETLRDQISAAIKASALMTATREHAAERRKLLRYILDVTPDMQRVQPLADLYPKILAHAIGMLDTSSHALPGQSQAPLPERRGTLAVVEGASLVIRASSDATAVGAAIDARFTDDDVTRMHEAMDSGSLQAGATATLIPLRMSEVSLGLLRVDGGGLPMPDVELLSTFANQASAAIRAMQLYEMAALDPLTGTHTRRFFEDWLLREVRAAFRARVPVTVLMMDMDGLKQINDGAGHLVGDEALASIGKALREATRASDLVGRYGGDEFVVILPRTAERVADRVAHRIVESVRDQKIKAPNGEVPLRLSIGASTLRSAATSVERLGKVPLEYFRKTVQTLLKHADEALYRAKRQGGMQVCKGQPATWPPAEPLDN